MIRDANGRNGWFSRRLMRLLAVGLMLGVLTTALPVYAQEGASGQEAPLETGQEISVGARAAILIDADSGRVLYRQNIHERMAMASTTKIMTTMLALEQEKIDEEFVVDTQSIHVEGSSMGLMENDIVTLRTLSYGMLLPSGNDAANATAVRIAGSQEAFVKLMNERAQQLGLVDTAFVTPSGLDADGHYSTAYDMAMLTKAAMENPDFREICKEYRAQVKFGNPPFERWLKNHNKLVNMYEGCIGVKTGFTDAAKRCLVSAAERDGVRLICVTLNAPDDWNIHSKLYDQAFAQLGSRSMAGLVPKELTLPLTGGKQGSVPMECAWEPMASVSADEMERVQVRVLHRTMEFAPVAAGDTLGEVQFLLDTQVIATVPLRATRAVELLRPPRRGFFEFIMDIFS